MLDPNPDCVAAQGGQPQRRVGQGLRHDRPPDLLPRPRLHQLLSQPSTLRKNVPKLPLWIFTGGFSLSQLSVKSANVRLLSQKLCWLPHQTHTELSNCFVESNLKTFNSAL